MLCCATPEQKYPYPALTVDHTFCPSYEHANVTFNALRWYSHAKGSHAAPTDLCATPSSGTLKGPQMVHVAPELAVWTGVQGGTEAGPTGWKDTALHVQNLGCRDL